MSYFITEDIEIYSEDSNSNEKTERKKIKCINLCFKRNKNNMINAFKLGTLKFLPDI